MSAKISILLCRFPYGGSEFHGCGTWLAKNVPLLKSLPYVAKVDHLEINDTPITMSRNRALKKARDGKYDFCIMLDSDMLPDLPYPGARPFFPHALDFAMNQRLAGKPPALVGAPYCGPPPIENIYVFQWASLATDEPQPSWKLEQYSREQAALQTGFESVGALPTGLILIDMRCLDGLAYPWFDYEWSDAEQTEKASTEDVYFTRNVGLGRTGECWCFWDAWAGHVKTKIVGKPRIMYTDDVAEAFRDALGASRYRQERTRWCNTSDAPYSNGVKDDATAAKVI